MSTLAAAEDSDAIRLSIEDGIGRLTLNRPAKRNAINSRMADCFVEACGRLRSETVSACIIDAEGATFCAGADVGDPLMSQAFNRLYEAKLDTPVIWIACVASGVVGAGVALVAACPVVIAGPGMWASLPEITKIGGFPAGVYDKASRFVDRRWLMSLALSGDRADASQCRRGGLVTEIAKEGEEFELARKWALKLGGCSGGIVDKARGSWLRAR